MSTENSIDKKKHFVLVHGACHGAWSWYKLKPLLESAGHKVTVLDLATSGINMKKIEDVDTISDYSDPLLELMATIPPNEKVVLVGHSLGGLSIALCMDKYPEKIAVGVFLAAFVPDVENSPSYVMEKYIESTPAAEWLDTEFSTCGNKTSMIFGPKFLSNKLYQNCSTEMLSLTGLSSEMANKNRIAYPFKQMWDDNKRLDSNQAIWIITQFSVSGIPFPDSITLEIFLDYKK